MKRQKISLRGVPCGVGAGQWGSSFGPEALFKKGIKARFESMGFDVNWRLLPDPLPHKEPFISGFQHKEAVLAWCEQLQKEIQNCLADHSLPVIIGGDHSISMGSLSGVAQYCEANDHSLTVVWLDAHGDFNTSETSQSGHIHGMPLASLCGHGDGDFLSMIGKTGKINPKDVHLLGVRDLDAQEEHLLASSGVHTYPMEVLRLLGFGTVLQDILEKARLKPSPHVHLSFDLDFMDASLAQGTGTPVPNGPTYGEVKELFQVINKSDLLKSMDIVEYNPLLDGQTQTAEVLFELLTVLFSVS